MRIGLIADIHANVYGLRAALEEIHNANVDLIICAGDVIGYYPFINETINILREENVLCVLGNHDAILTNKLSVAPEKWHEYNLDFSLPAIEPQNLTWLEQLPFTRNINIDGYKIEIFHGSPWKPLTDYIYPEKIDLDMFSKLPMDYLILGHTHIPFVERTGKVTIINPGSCGQPRDYHPGACYGILSILEKKVELRRAEYDNTELLTFLKNLNYDQKLIDILIRTKKEDIL